MREGGLGRIKPDFFPGERASIIPNPWSTMEPLHAVNSDQISHWNEWEEERGWVPSSMLG